LLALVDKSPVLAELVADLRGGAGTMDE